MFNFSNLMQHPNENVKSHLTQQPVISNGRFVATFMLEDTTSIGSVATRANTDLFEYSPAFIQVFKVYNNYSGAYYGTREYSNMMGKDYAKHGAANSRIQCRSMSSEVPIRREGIKDAYMHGKLTSGGARGPQSQDRAYHGAVFTHNPAVP